MIFNFLCIMFCNENTFLQLQIVWCRLEMQYSSYMTKFLLTSSTIYIGHFDLVNFRDITTTTDLDTGTLVKFEFEFDPLFPLSPVNTNIATLVDDLQLAWSQISGVRSGVIRFSQLERVGQTETYRISVPLHRLGEGHLLVNFTINIFCSQSRRQYSRYWRISECIKWLISATSNPLEIRNKRG